MTEHTDSLMPLITASPQADAPLCREAEAPWSAAEARQCVIGRIPWTEGIEPQPRALLPGYDSGVMALLLGVFVISAQLPPLLHIPVHLHPEPLLGAPARKCLR